MHIKQSIHRAKINIWHARGYSPVVTVKNANK